VGSTHLAVDLGAESGRAFVGNIGDELAIEEIGRFQNRTQRLGDRLAWDIDAIRAFVTNSAATAGSVDSLAIDTWGVDFGLLRSDGTLIAPPRCYRDPYTRGAIQRLEQRIPAAELYRRTGIQKMDFNTICQLLVMAESDSAELTDAHCLLLIPDLLRYWLGADAAAERTNASTTQLLGPGGDWDYELAGKIGVDARILPPVVQSFERVGTTADGVAIVAGASHDTAAAVAGAPLDDGSVFISSGTWSLVGIELPAPVINETARGLNLSSEHGVAGTTRLLRNVMGLWLLQECRRTWAKEDGEATEYSALMDLATSAAAMGPLIDPDDPEFLRPTDLPAAIASFCARTQQQPPDSRGAVVRSIIDSLALRYRWVIEAIERCTGADLTRINLVGGGSQNSLLCQATADATGLVVEAGPQEATVLGNVVVQGIARGSLTNLAQGRKLVRRSFPPVRFEPRPGTDWDSAYERFCALTPATRRPERSALTA
jgi:rhamnulokinase